MHMKVCTYCQRQMLPRDTDSPLESTRDHVHPLSKGGRKTVAACWHCNNLKGDMLEAEWAAFMTAHPEWWRRHEFQRNRQTKHLPIEHSQFILKHGKEAYHKWVRMLAEQAYLKRYGVWRLRSPGQTERTTK